jgi:hypothetical protein
VNIKGIKYRSAVCSVTAGLGEVKKSQETCVESVTDAHKNVLKKAGHVKGQSSKLANIIIFN